MADLIRLALPPWLGGRVFSPGKRHIAQREIISQATLLGYVNMKATIIFCDLAVGVVVPVYLEVYDMNIGTLSIFRALAKAIDVVMAFAVGYVSDQTTTMFGRRLPFIAFGSVVAPMSLYYLASPPEAISLNAEAAVQQATAEAPHEVCLEYAKSAQMGNCTQLQACLADNIDSGLLPRWDHADSGHAQERRSVEKSAALVAWFFAFFTLRHSFGHTLIVIPYDALGQELSNEAEERQKLFASKSFYNFVGLFAAYIMQVYLAMTMANDISTQAKSAVNAAAIAAATSALWLLSTVREREPDRAREKKDKVPFLATMNALARNKPYRNYILIRLFLTFGFHLPLFTRLNYLKYVVGFENAALATTVSALAAQLTSFVSLPTSLRLMRRWGKKKLLVILTCFASVMAAWLARTPRATIKAEDLYALQPIVEGLTQVALYTIPEFIIADVIDYDELLHGRRREGIFFVLDLNVMQLMDIAAGVLPGILLAMLGYRGNAGCSCGCGSKCSASYLRWSCKEDIGYACTADLSSENSLLFGSPDRSPPCTEQHEVVEAALQTLFFTLPAVCFGLAAIFALMAPIDDEVRAIMTDQLTKRREGAHQVYDPVTKAPVTDSNESHDKKVTSNTIGSFSEDEQALMLTDGGIFLLRRELHMRLGVTGVAIPAVIALAYRYRSPAASTIVIFTVAILLMYMLWVGLKVFTIATEYSRLKVYSNATRFDRRKAHGSMRVITDPKDHDIESSYYLPSGKSSGQSHCQGHGARKAGSVRTASMRTASMRTASMRSAEDDGSSFKQGDNHDYLARLKSTIGNKGMARIEGALKNWMRRASLNARQGSSMSSSFGSRPGSLRTSTGGYGMSNANKRRLTPTDDADLAHGRTLDAILSPRMRQGLPFGDDAMGRGGGSFRSYRSDTDGDAGTGVSSSGAGGRRRSSRGIVASARELSPGPVVLKRGSFQSDAPIATLSGPGVTSDGWSKAKTKPPKRKDSRKVSLRQNPFGGLFQ